MKKSREIFVALCSLEAGTKMVNGGNNVNEDCRFKLTLLVCVTSQLTTAVHNTMRTAPTN